MDKTKPLWWLNKTDETKRLWWLSEQEQGWISGLLEGEGCFYTRKHLHKGSGHTHIELTLSCNMTDEDIIRKLHSLAGGVYYGPCKVTGPDKEKEYRPNYVWMVHGDLAAYLMRSLYLLMGKRRQEAIVKSLYAWDFRLHRRGDKRNSKPWSEERRAQFEKKRQAALDDEKED